MDIQSVILLGLVVAVPVTCVSLYNHVTLGLK